MCRAHVWALACGLFLACCVDNAVVPAAAFAYSPRPAPSPRLAPGSCIGNSQIAQHCAARPTALGHAAISARRVRRHLFNLLCLAGPQNDAQRSQTRTPPAGRQLKDDVIPEAFKEFDRNNDGFIDASELKLVMMSLGEELTDEGADQLIRQVDLDGDGSISFVEFAKIARSRELGNRLRSTAIPEVSRQVYQRAALGGLVSAGQQVPGDWCVGDQFAFLADDDFKAGEVVVVVMQDGNLIFGKIHQRLSAAGPYSVMIAQNRLGPKYVEVAASKVGRVLTLSQREIQRLGRRRQSSTGTYREGRIKNGDLFSSIRDMVDVEKTQVRDGTLPFPPMLSRMTKTSSEKAPEISPKPEGRISSVMSGAGSGEWGDLEGWWRNENSGTDTFEVLLQRPLGMELDEVEGEGVFVRSLQQAGNAQRAGVRVGDRIQVPGTDPTKTWNEDLVSVLSAISESSGNRMRMRYVRSVAAASPAIIANNKQPLRDKAQNWRGQTSSVDAYGEWDVLVKKPIGMRLTEVEGKGLFVLELEIDGNAEKAGIRVGDRVVRTSIAPGFESGTTFDRGTTYFMAVYSKSGPTALQRFISEVKAPGGAIDIGLERTKEGQQMMEKFVARQKLGVIDESLSAKVKRAVLGPYMPRDGDSDERVIGTAPEEDPSGEQMLAAGRPLKINLDLLSHTAREAIQSGDLNLGEELYQRCTRMDPRDGRGWLGLAKLFERKRQNAKAREILLEGLTKSPKNPFLLQSLGCLEVKSGNLAEANRRFQQATNANPRHAASWVSWGKLEERLRRPGRARQCYATATVNDPGNYYAWHCLAVLESKLGHVGTARELFKKCTDVNPRNAASWQAWGTMERQAGNIDEAAKLLARGLRESPRNTWVMQALALLEWDRGDTEEAQNLFQKAIAIKPWDGGIYQAFGVLLHRSGNIQRARLLFKEGSMAAKDDAALWQAWALMEADVGKVAEARALFQQGVWGAGSSRKCYQLWQAWGLLEAKEGNLEEARKYLARAVDTAGRPANSLLAWALVEERQGAITRCRELMEMAVKAEPSSSHVWAAFLSFARRAYGEASAEATSVYQRKVVAEIRTSSERDEVLPQLSSNGRQGSAYYEGVFESASGTENSQEDDYEVLMKARWGGAPKRRGQGSGTVWSNIVPDPL